eukprot:2356990-Pleurochrysis_carterae.AAC.3
MMCTRAETPPPPDAMRCLPLRCVAPARTPPLKLWDDAGSSGAAGSVWIVNNMGMAVISPGHEAPAGPFYDLVLDAKGGLRLD